MNFILKPVFIGWSTLITQLPFQLFFTVWSGGFFGAILGQLNDNYAHLPINTFMLMGGLAFIFFPIIIYSMKKYNYKKTEYRFFSDRIEFEEGFFTVHKKVIKFEDIKEVSLRKGIFQQVNGLGTIYLATMATGTSYGSNPFQILGFGNTSASGISIKDVIQPDQEYEKIRSLIELQKTKH